MDLNEVNLIGRITSEVELKQTPNGNMVANFSVATNEQYKDKEGEKRDVATFHNLVVWGKLAEIVGEYGGKGSKVFVKGKLQTRAWDDPNGGSKRYKTEILASSIILLDSRGRDEEQEEEELLGKDTKAPAKSSSKTPTKKRASVEEEINIEDIPF